MEGVFFKKEIERVGGLLKEKEGREGVLGKTALLLLPHDGPPSSSSRWPWELLLLPHDGPGSTAAAGKWGKTERRPRGSDSPTHLGAEVVCGGRATVASGGGRLWPWRRRCRLGEGASGGGEGCGGRELRGGPLYRPGEAVERGAPVTELGGR